MHPFPLEARLIQQYHGGHTESTILTPDQMNSRIKAHYVNLQQWVHPHRTHPSFRYQENKNYVQGHAPSNAQGQYIRTNHFSRIVAMSDSEQADRMTVLSDVTCMKPRIPSITCPFSSCIFVFGFQTHSKPRDLFAYLFQSSSFPIALAT